VKENSFLINMIVPVHNVEQYISKCIDSILAQTYTNLRIILVDDGSSDKCPEICDRYARRDTRVKVIHCLNNGQAAARNRGLDLLHDRYPPESRGDYVAFVDADDYIAPDYIEFLHNLIVDNNADIAQCGHYVVFSETRMVDKNRDHNTTVLNKTQAIESLCYNGIYDITACSKLYRVDIFNNIRFPEGYLYEDTAVCYLVAEKAKSIVVNMTPKYYYIQRYNSTANSVLWQEYKYQFLAAGDEMANYISEHYPELTKAANVKRVFVRLSTLSQMVNCNHYDKERIAEMTQVIKKYGRDVLRDGKAAKRDKLGVMALSLGFPFYRTAWKLYYRIVRRQQSNSKGSLCKQQ